LKADRTAADDEGRSIPHLHVILLIAGDAV
jgi:hypothetical protein